MAILVGKHPTTGQIYIDCTTEESAINLTLALTRVTNQGMYTPVEIHKTKDELVKLTTGK